MKYLVTPVFAIFALTSCTTIEEKTVDLKMDIDTVFSENSEGIKLFFAKEAAEAGVTKIRAMDESEKPPKIHPLQSGCGVAFNQRRLILIDTSRKKCINLHNLSHEISHIGAKCGRHVDRFYKYKQRGFVFTHPTTHNKLNTIASCNIHQECVICDDDHHLCLK